MNKATLTLVASSGLLGALLLVVNPANAAETVSQNTNTAVRHQNPAITLNQRQANPILDQLGCSCAACTTSRRQQLQGKMPF